MRIVRKIIIGGLVLLVIAVVGYFALLKFFWPSRGIVDIEVNIPDPSMSEEIKSNEIRIYPDAKVGTEYYSRIDFDPYEVRRLALEKQMRIVPEVVGELPPGLRIWPLYMQTLDEPPSFSALDTIELQGVPTRAGEYFFEIKFTDDYVQKCKLIIKR
jgi:hypothetical protein